MIFAIFAGLFIERKVIIMTLKNINKWHIQQEKHMTKREIICEKIEDKMWYYKTRLVDCLTSMVRKKQQKDTIRYLTNDELYKMFIEFDPPMALIERGDKISRDS